MTTFRTLKQEKKDGKKTIINGIVNYDGDTISEAHYDPENFEIVTYLGKDNGMDVFMLQGYSGMSADGIWIAYGVKGDEFN